MLNIKWDSQKNDYTYQDGSMLPVPLVKDYRRDIWKLEGMNMDAEMILQRWNETWLEVTVNEEIPAGRSLRQGVLNVFTNGNWSEPWVKFEFFNQVGEGEGSIESATGDVREGEVINAQLIVNGVTNYSPVFTP